MPKVEREVIVRSLGIALQKFADLARALEQSPGFLKFREARFKELREQEELKKEQNNSKEGLD